MNCFSSFKCVLYDFRVGFRVCGVKVGFLWGLNEKGIALFGFSLVVEVKFGLLCDFCVKFGFLCAF